jgi:orotidine-5'-phosphate decarboxylase
MQKNNNLDKTIIALDFSDLAKLTEFIDSFDYQQELRPRFVKVGMELFYAQGRKIIEYLKEKNLKIFLDLKVHDIPNTAFKALTALKNLEVDILNLHAAGGIAMMQKAKEALADSKTKLIAVTILTSLDDQALTQELLINKNTQETVLHYAQNAYQAGLDGIVCSAHEAQSIKDSIHPDFLTVCPGIRFADGKSQDQKRVADPAWALANGCDYIVMGRAITQASDKAQALMSLL